MRITVRVFSGLKRYIPQSARPKADRTVWEVPSGTTVQDVVDSLEIPSIVVFAIAVNSVLNRDLSLVLKEGDDISIQPMLTGG